MTINKKHMGLAQALYAAEETARSETELAARMQRDLKEREKAKKEAQLRELAAAARMGGGGLASLASRLDDREGTRPPLHLSSTAPAERVRAGGRDGG